jgi:hypothetical protein
MPGTRGLGYANTENEYGLAVVWSVRSEEGGPVTMIFRFSSIDDRAGSLYISGILVENNISFYCVKQRVDSVTLGNN